MIFLMSVPAQGPVTIYAPQPVSVVGSLPPERRSKFQSKLKILLSILVVSGILSGFYPLIGEVRGVLTQGGSAVTLDRVLDENFNLSLVGNLEGSQLISTATDSDPLVVNSTSLVDNLNADLLDGQSGSYYIDTFPATGWTDDGATVRLTTVTDRVGIGTTAPEEPLHVFRSDTTGTDSLVKSGVFDLFLYADDATPGTNIYMGVQGRTRYYGVSGETAYAVAGVRGSFLNMSSGDVTEAVGVYTSVGNNGTGTIDRAIGFYNPAIANLSTGTINEAYGLLIGSPINSGGGTITDNYGIFIGNQSCAGCTNIWAVYAEAGDSYMNGNLTIGEQLRTTANSTNALNLLNNGISLESYFDVGVFLDNDNDDTGEAFRVLMDGASIELFTVDDSELRTIQPSFFESGVFTGLATGTLGYLSVLEDYGSDGIARVVDLTTTDDADVQVLRLGLGTDDTSGASSRFISFYASATGEDDGTGVGRIRLNSGGVAYETGGADYAEYVDVSSPVSQGDIISISGSGKKAVTGEHIIGVVSDTAGFVGNAKSEEPEADQAIVGFLGQILTKVTGNVQPGDLITASDIPGVGIEATEKGRIVGVALGSHSGDSVSKIRVFVNPGWWDPGTEITPEGTASVEIPDQLKLIGVEAEEGWFEKLITKMAEIASAIVENLKVKFLTVGDSEVPTGITIYDRANGEPYCVAVNEGTVVTTAGVCE